MSKERFPPRSPPLSLDHFDHDAAREIVPFNPGPVDMLIRKYAAGLQPRPDAAQLRDWMNNEAPIPAIYHPAIRDTVAKMTGRDCMVFSQNNGSSLRGFAYLLHATHAFSHRAVHYVDQWSDVGDRRQRWGDKYGSVTPGM